MWPLKRARWRRPSSHGPASIVPAFDLLRHLGRLVGHRNTRRERASQRPDVATRPPRGCGSLKGPPGRAGCSAKCPTTGRFRDPHTLLRPSREREASSGRAAAWRADALIRSLPRRHAGRNETPSAARAPQIARSFGRSTSLQESRTPAEISRLRVRRSPASRVRVLVESPKESLLQADHQIWPAAAFAHERGSGSCGPHDRFDLLAGSLRVIALATSRSPEVLDAGESSATIWSADGRLYRALAA